MQCRGQGGESMAASTGVSGTPPFCLHSPPSAIFTGPGTPTPAPPPQHFPPHWENLALLSAGGERRSLEICSWLLGTRLRVPWVLRPREKLLFP